MIAGRKEGREEGNRCLSHRLEDPTKPRDSDPVASHIIAPAPSRRISFWARKSPPPPPFPFLFQSSSCLGLPTVPPHWVLDKRSSARIHVRLCMARLGGAAAAASSACLVRPPPPPSRAPFWRRTATAAARDRADWSKGPKKAVLHC